MSEQVTVIAKMHAKAGQEKRVHDTLLAMLKPTRAEAGCISYDLHAGKEDLRSFVFYENWASPAAFEGHLKTAHLQALLAIADEVFDSGIDLTYWSKLS